MCSKFFAILSSMIKFKKILNIQETRFIDPLRRCQNFPSVFIKNNDCFQDLITRGKNEWPVRVSMISSC